MVFGLMLEPRAHSEFSLWARGILISPPRIEMRSLRELIFSEMEHKSFFLLTSYRFMRLMFLWPFKCSSLVCQPAPVVALGLSFSKDKGDRNSLWEKVAWCDGLHPIVSVGVIRASVLPFNLPPPLFITGDWKRLDKHDKAVPSEESP